MRFDSKPFFEYAKDSAYAVLGNILTDVVLKYIPNGTKGYNPDIAKALAFILWTMVGENTRGELSTLAYSFGIGNLVFAIFDVLQKVLGKQLGLATVQYLQPQVIPPPQVIMPPPVEEKKPKAQVLSAPIY